MYKQSREGYLKVRLSKEIWNVCFVTMEEPGLIHCGGRGRESSLTGALGGTLQSQPAS